MSALRVFPLVLLCAVFALASCGGEDDKSKTKSEGTEKTKNVEPAKTANTNEAKLSSEEKDRLANEKKAKEIASLPYPERRRLDGENLKTLARGMALELGSSKRGRKARAADKEHASFLELVTELCHMKVFSAYDLTRLAGAAQPKRAGTLADRIDGGGSFKAEEVIFTGPTSGAQLAKLLDSKDAMKDGVLMTYNESHFDEALASEDGKVVLLLVGEFELRLMTLAEIEEHFKDSPNGRPELVGKQAKDILGKYPFHNVALR